MATVEESTTWTVSESGFGFAMGDATYSVVVTDASGISVTIPIGSVDGVIDALTDLKAAAVADGYTPGG